MYRTVPAEKTAILLELRIMEHTSFKCCNQNFMLSVNTSSQCERNAAFEHCTHDSKLQLKSVD